MKPLSRFPRVSRDISFYIDRSITYARLIAFIWKAQVPNLERVDLIDLYEDIHRSLTLRLCFEAERTLTGREVDQAREKIVAGLREEFGVVTR